MIKNKFFKEKFNMAYCAHCGNLVDDNAQFCGSCGASRTAQQPQQTYQTFQQPMNQAYYQPQPQPVSKKGSILSLVFGALSLLFGILSIYIMLAGVGIIFLIPAIVFIIVSKKQRNNYVRQAGQDNGFSRAGGILSTIAIPVTIVFALIGLFAFIAILGEL